MSQGCAEPDCATTWAMVQALRAERERQGLTRTDVARRMSTTRAVVARLENRRGRETRLGTLQRYARALGMPLGFQLRGPDGSAAVFGEQGGTHAREDDRVTADQ